MNFVVCTLFTLHQYLILVADLVLPFQLVLYCLRVLLEVRQPVAARRGRVRDRAHFLDSPKEGSYLFFFPCSRDGVLGRIYGGPCWPPPHVSCCEERGGGVSLRRRRGSKSWECGFGVKAVTA